MRKKKTALSICAIKNNQIPKKYERFNKKNFIKNYFDSDFCFAGFQYYFFYRIFAKHEQPLFKLLITMLAY